MPDERTLIALVVLSFLMRTFGPWIRVMLRLHLREKIMRHKGSGVDDE